MSYSVIVNGARRCIVCGQTKEIAEFYRFVYTTKQGNQSERLDSRCKPCARARRRLDYVSNIAARTSVARQYKAARRELLNDKVRRYRSENAEKVRSQRVIYEQKRRAKSSLDSAESRALIERVLAESRFGDRYLDAYTGDLIEKPEIDHIVPLKAGGAHAYENLCVTSGRNNRSKNARAMLIWMASR